MREMARIDGWGGWLDGSGGAGSTRSARGALGSASLASSRCSVAGAARGAGQTAPTFTTVKYPIGHQDFRKIREGGFAYVDKTEHICRLIEHGGYFFLSRPRRFGKSLTVATMNELYSGSAELFDGLWAGEHWGFAERQRPVLWFRFANLDYETKGVTEALHAELRAMALEHEVDIGPEVSVKDSFRYLIERVAGKRPRGRVVVLIDEYDKPIIDYVDDLAQAQTNRDELRAFYSVLKDADPYLELVFLTGVSAFAKVSLFSDLNNLDNVTLSPEAFTLVGITQTELEKYFGAQLDASGYSREQVRHWYNGYAWGDHERVYNPWSILKFLKKRQLQNFWSDSGTPTFVTKRMAQGGNFDVAPVKVSQLELLSFSLEGLNPVGVLFQSGYLTVKQDLDATRRYHLDYPNEEVRQTFLETLLKAYNFDEPSAPSARVTRLHDAFAARDLDTVIQVIDASLAAVPYELWAQKSEAMVHAIIHTTFTVLGLYTRSEVSTARGRADIVVEVPRYVYVIELKLGRTAAEALAQIEARGYAAPYADDEREVIRVGIAFDTEARRVAEWVEG